MTPTVGAVLRTHCAPTALCTDGSRKHMLHGETEEDCVVGCIIKYHHPVVHEASAATAPLPSPGTHTHMPPNETQTVQHTRTQDAHSTAHAATQHRKNDRQGKCTCCLHMKRTIPCTHHHTPGEWQAASTTRTPISVGRDCSNRQSECQQ